MKFDKLIVLLVIVLNILFVVADFYVVIKTGIEPIATVTAWFAFTTGELWLLASIKKVKVKRLRGEKRDEI